MTISFSRTDKREVARRFGVLFVNFASVISGIFLDGAFEGEAASARQIFADLKHVARLNFRFALEPGDASFVAAHLALEFVLAANVRFRFFRQLPDKRINLVRLCETVFSVLGKNFSKRNIKYCTFNGEVCTASDSTNIDRVFALVIDFGRRNDQFVNVVFYGDLVA